MNFKKAAIVLAAGKGKRMKSDLPKVLHEIAGKPMICHVMETFREFDFDKIVVVIGHKGELVKEALSDFDVEFVWQNEQLGTGHAVMMAEDNFIGYEGTILVAAGDVPFLTRSSIEHLFEVHNNNKASATCLSAEFADPTGYGRIVRESNTDLMNDIIEEKDASPDIKKITEINSGTFCFDAGDLFPVLHRIKNNNAQEEYYLTDAIRHLRKDNKICAVWVVPNNLEVTGVNSVEQLKTLENKIIEKNLLD